MKTKNVFMYILAGLLTLAFCSLIGILLFVEVPEGNTELVYTLAGIVGSAFLLMVGYFFGSSQGSADKNDMINHLNGNS